MDTIDAPPVDGDRAGRALHIGITGHRDGNAAFDASKDAVAAILGKLFDALSGNPDGGQESELCAKADDIRIITCLAHGADMLAARLAMDRGWKVHAPLPFGHAINMALNTNGLSFSQMHDALTGTLPDDPAVQASWRELQSVADYAQLFELAEQDDLVARQLAKAAKEGAPLHDVRDFDLLIADRTSSAGLIAIEQSDIMIAIWDGISASALGGTRDTIGRALALDVPVLWINPNAQCDLRLLLDPADVVAVREGASEQASVQAMANQILNLARPHWEAQDEAARQFKPANWRDGSSRWFHTYRRIEQFFGDQGRRFASLSQTYERPDQIALGGSKDLLERLSTLPGSDKAMAERIGQEILPRFAFADGLSSFFSDAYRGGMVASFLLSAAAIVAGVAYLPIVPPEMKWPFALVEFILLTAIVVITIAGTRGNWHRRWFRTRRVAEYLRHAPIMLTLGCTRAIGRWPISRDDNWPEHDSRMLLLGLGLPEMAVSRAYLREHLDKVLRPFLAEQGAYHRAKSHRLERVHHNLDRMSEVLFVCAIISVGVYLLLELLAALTVINLAFPLGLSKLFTFFGVAFPTLGAALAGIRYFGDFERFAAISDVTAEKLDRLAGRADAMLKSQDNDLNYRDYAHLAHSMNDVAIEEIESWQSIFGTKKMSVPV